MAAAEGVDIAVSDKPVLSMVEPPLSQPPGAGARPGTASRRQASLGLIRGRLLTMQPHT